MKKGKRVENMEGREKLEKEKERVKEFENAYEN